MKVSLPNGFTPREYQRRAMGYLDNGGLRYVGNWHRRAGKDLVFAHQACKAAHQRRGVYWHVYPTAEQARKAIWEGFTKDGQRILEQVFPRAIRKSPVEWRPQAEMVVEMKCGSMWRLLGSDKMEVVGAGPVGVVFTEFALAKPKTWDLVRPMLRENGGWAAFVSTPRGRNHFWKLYQMAQREPGWLAETWTLHDTRAYDPERTIAEERAEGMDEALIQQEYFCDFAAAVQGSVWGDLVDVLGDRGEAAVDTKAPVFTSWDLGMSDATAIWVWRPRGTGAEFVAHHEAHGQPLSYYFDWLEAQGYTYRKHWLPHDARAKTLAADVSILDQFRHRYGAGAVSIGPPLSLLDGIQAARWLLQQPSTRFGPLCADGVEALRAYRYEWDDDKKCFTRRPVHDWSSHSADGFRYAACVVRTTERLTRPPPAEKAAPVVRSLASYGTLDELFEANESGRI